MNDTAEIYLWDTRIGIIHTLPGRAYSSFEYDNDFLKSGIELSPIKMPLSTIIYQFPDLAEPPFFGMPGLVADSLPDKFGNEIINQWLLFHGLSLSDFTAIDRQTLLYRKTRDGCARICSINFRHSRHQPTDQCE